MSFAAPYARLTVNKKSAAEQPPLDWLTFPGVDIVDAPHPDLFESELELSLSSYDQAQLDQLSLDFTADPFAFRSDTTGCGPLSTFTVSSESTYGDSLSSHSESLYSACFSASTPPNAAYNSIDNSLDIDFSGFSVGDITLPDVPNEHPSPPSFDFDLSIFPGDTTTFLPTIDTMSMAVAFAQQPAPPSSHSGSSASGSASPPPSRVTEHHRPSGSDGGDARKKYSCDHCSRSFARAFNLKTHMATHDPNRPKPHVCHACNRSFSRKHDLGRHLISIHKDDTQLTPTSASFTNIAPTPSTAHPSLTHSRTPSTGARAMAKAWCISCGKSNGKDCACDDAK
jgi:hypothetical protein